MLPSPFAIRLRHAAAAFASAVPAGTRRRRFVAALVGAALAAILLAAAAVAADRLFPLPPLETPGSYSLVVTSADGTPLRIFADAQGVWRYPVTIEQVAPRYLEALIGYEDRAFWRHLGVDPAALLRAAFQRVKHSRVISGGSTLSMQVARLLDPNRRSVAGKLKQIFRALQLEAHYSKRDILTWYLNHAPFGGPLEGVAAASYGYLGKPPSRLSPAEAALLAVLPQSPSTLRPDRYPARAQAARDKVLKRLVDYRVWPQAMAHEARAETVRVFPYAPPMHAPLLAERLRREHPNELRLVTTIDANIQMRLETLARTQQHRLPAATSLAIFVVDNRTGESRAYVGSGDFFDDRRYGQIDMVAAVRSPGSTLKPFLYGLALDDGLIHSESLLVDAPQDFNGYRPENFGEDFRGPVSVAEALQRSLNVPAVDVLDRLGPARFAAALENGGLALFLPPDEPPGLPLILGGAGTTLEHLVGAYTSLARGGMAIEPRLLAADPLTEHRMSSAGAAFIVHDILSRHARPELPLDAEDLPGRRRVAWKTGTSYGFRDSWAIGVTGAYTVGVWVGRPDGTPVPGLYGAVTAAPILFDVVDALPAPAADSALHRPASVATVAICWPLGTRFTHAGDPLCEERRDALILNGLVPPTLPDRIAGIGAAPIESYFVNPKTGLTIPAGCDGPPREARELARWPLLLEPYLPATARHILPPVDPACARETAVTTHRLHVTGIAANAVLRQPTAGRDGPRLSLAALGGAGIHYWLVNGELQSTTATARFEYRCAKPGAYQLTVFDEHGAYDSVAFRVIE